MLTFYLNGQQINESSLDADVTLLRYLRSNKNLVGTKEGCASGDCGACTVLIGELHGSDWSYHSINSCITFMSQLDGKSIITVEALASSKDDMHPAQTALVEKHASQCGFCTPGFVMSMVGLYESHAGQTLSRTDIEEALSGNLCRCTGYRPIIEASESMLNDYEDTVQIWRPEQALNTSSESSLQNEHSQSWTPRTEDQLKALLTEHSDAKMVAGATDLALLVTQAHQRITKLISLNQIPALKKVTLNATELVIGAATPYREAEALLKKHFPEFGAMLARLGSKQIRNHGTLGGNIANASPIGDTPPVLIALGATLELASQKGHRTIPIEQFFLDYKKTALAEDEYLRAIHIPRLKENEALKVYKISKRLEDDISAVLMAAKFKIENQTITNVKTGFGGMAAIPKSAPLLEQALINQTLNESSFEHAAPMISQDFNPIDDVRATAAYRVQVAKGLVIKCGIELCSPSKTTRVEQIHSASVTNVVEAKHA